MVVLAAVVVVVELVDTPEPLAPGFFFPNLGGGGKMVKSGLAGAIADSMELWAFRTIPLLMALTLPKLEGGAGNSSLPLFSSPDFGAFGFLGLGLSAFSTFGDLVVGFLVLESIGFLVPASLIFFDPFSLVFLAPDPLADFFGFSSSFAVVASSASDVVGVGDGVSPSGSIDDKVTSLGAGANVVVLSSSVVAVDVESGSSL